MKNMKKIIVAGLINVETTVEIHEYPIEYQPIEYNFWGIESAVSGVGLNVAKALNILGNQVCLVSLIGNDMNGKNVKMSLKKEGLSTIYIKSDLKQTPQSVVMYDADGKRKIYLDLKDVQQREYPIADEVRIFEDVELVVACNINFSRNILHRAIKEGIKIASDVHVLDSIEDDYNKEYMEKSDILFMSNEKICGKEEDFIHEVALAYDNEIIVIGMGERGAVLYERDKELKWIPAVKSRKIVSTIGAGDALFSAFVHFYVNGMNAENALHRAVWFASYKIGAKGAASGFLSVEELDKLIGEDKKGAFKNE